jgi:hypothetical protein
MSDSMQMILGWVTGPLCILLLGVLIRLFDD